MSQGHEVSDEMLLERLRRQPAIRGRLVALLDVAEDSEGDLRRADDAELRLTQEIRRLGQEMMQAWADYLDGLAAGGVVISINRRSA